MESTPHIYLVAGESSGDLLGGKLMMALKKIHPELTFSGLGGPKMGAQGLAPLFDFSELSLMGFAEVLPHIRKLKRRMAQVRDDIIAKQPEIVVTIDSPGFNFRLVKQLRESGKVDNIKFLHYVAPTVWAYKPKRAEKVATLFDKLLVLLPFEPPYFEREGLSTTFIGHPVLEDDYTRADGQAFREKHGILPGAPLMLLLPGSRTTEIRRHLTIFQQTLELLAARFGGLAEVIIVPKNMEHEIQEHLEDWPGHPIIVTEQDEKHDAFAAATVALVKSGTITLELACARVPMVVTYRVSAITAWLLRRMIKVKYVSLVNLLLNREAIPELIQEKCHPDKLATKLSGFLSSNEMGDKQIEEAQAALAQLIPESGQPPSQIAAKEVLKLALQKA
ncbi:MAG: lipid-A-disaccharide synthase [Rickettsiales bacterium]|nr:lipid-A-disaccharide synthase [Rickettsiales bacterium]